ncbi:MAG: (Fe-S)-binding protein [Polyangiaceae bacterium]
MGPIWMAVVILGLSAAFMVSANKRMRLLLTGRYEVRWDRLGERLFGVYEYALAQKKMAYYRLAGVAHKAIFIGFIVLLINTIMLWGRGFWAPFNLWIFGPEPVIGIPLGHAYELLKDVIAVLVISGAATFVYLRTVNRQRRMTLSGEGLLILGIIITMMVADLLYNGAMLALGSKATSLACSGADAELCDQVKDVVAPLDPKELGKPVALHWYAPAASVISFVVQGVRPKYLVLLAHAGFWAHSALVLIFANILPHSKHFHIITAIPNVFARNIEKPGKLPIVAKTSEELGAMVEKAFENAPGAAPVGKSKIEDFSWKAILDFYTCTECGRCSDNCPAHKTGKMLSPKMLTLNLRDHLYGRDDELIEKSEAARAKANGHANGHADAAGEHAEGEGAEAAADGAEPEAPPAPVELVGNVIHPDVLWACTTCRACEEQCPVMISYVDKIVEMRRNLVLIKGEIPAELTNPFGAMETNGNPWNLARSDRAAWSDGLGVKTMAEHPKAKVLYWVGCAASYDDRAKKVARATARLMQAAKVDFAILGEEETCTGDPARRAGNEYLFMTLAEQNIATMKGYKEQGGLTKIVTACPHCFNTLANEYPDFGDKYEVVHHSDFLYGLVAEKKLVPKAAVKGRVVYHDSCYLGRYNGVYEPPREILKRIPGVELVEVEGWNRNKGLCCGAGGAQMWMEEQNKDRVNVKRTLQLVDTGAKTIASGCPFCQTMLTDGLKAESKEDQIKQLDVAEMLLQSCALADGPAPSAKPDEEEDREDDVEDAGASV